MKIGLNGQRILLEEPAGPEKYTINLFKAFSKIDQDNEYIIYLTQKPDKDFFNSLKQDNPHVSYKILPSTLSWTQVGLAHELLTNPIDILFSSVHTIPIVRHSRLKIVGMIHGLEYKYSKEFSNPIRKLTINWPERYVCQNSDKIIVPSRATKEAIISEKWKGVDNNNIEIIHEGVDQEFYKRSEMEVTKIRKKYDLKSEPYIIAVSTLQPRKNYINMIAGFSKFLMESDPKKEFTLVIVGKYGWNYQEIIEAPKKYGIEEKVKFLGRVPDKDLPILYSGAACYISTSLEEGFGLPLIEALACEIPVIVSDIPAYREVASNFPLFINPKEPESIQKGLTDLFSNTTNKEKINKAKNYAKSYSWEECAKKILTIMKDLYHS